MKNILSLSISITKNHKYYNKRENSMQSKTSFCPNCKRLLVPKRIDGRLLRTCGTCDYSEIVRRDDGSTPTATITVSEPAEDKGKIIILSGNDSSTVERICEHCGNDRAIMGEIGASRMNDEQGVVTFTCTKCKHTDRDYISGSYASR